MRRLALLLLLLVLPAMAQDLNAFLAEGMMHVESGDYAAALATYQKGLELYPQDPSLLFNAGLAANLVRDWPLALSLWQRFRGADPDNWKGREKTIQALEGAERESEAQAEVDDLRRLWKSGQDKQLSAEPSFVRDLFPARPYQVTVLEHFQGEHLWDFLVLGDDYKPRSMFYLAQAGGQFVFRRRAPEGGDTTLSSDPERPDYARVRDKVRQLVLHRHEGHFLNGRGLLGRQR